MRIALLLLLTASPFAASAAGFTLSDTLRTGYDCNGGYGELQIRADNVALPNACQMAQHQGGAAGARFDHHWPFHWTCVTSGLAPGPHTFSVHLAANGCGNMYLGWQRGHALFSVEELN